MTKNVVAKDLRTPKYKQRRVESKKKYNNKPKYKKQWRWACGYRDALVFAKIVWPYAQVKLHKLEQIIDHYEPNVQGLNDNVVDLAAERNLRTRWVLE